MNVAAIDLGSNSFHLLVARAGDDDTLEKLGSQKEMLRLGERLAPDGTIPEAELERALVTLGTLLETAHGLEAERIVAVGTSALREAGNAGDLVREAARRFGLPIEIVSGDEEARLVYRGARSRLRDLPDRALVIDLGGGSVELAVGDGTECLRVDSLPLGFLRLARALELDGPLNGAAVARLNEHVRAKAEDALRALAELSPRAWVLCGGTARALGRIAATLGVRELSGAGLRRLGAHLAARDPSHLVTLGVEADRAARFGVGVAVLATLVELSGAPVVNISAGGLREGIVLREASRRRSASRLTAPGTRAA